MLSTCKNTGLINPVNHIESHDSNLVVTGSAHDLDKKAAKI